MFSQKGIIVLEYNGQDEDKIMEDCFEAGATDFSIEDSVIEVTTELSDISSVRAVLTNLGYNVISAEVEQIPATYTKLSYNFV